LTRNLDHHPKKRAAPKRNWRHVHHSPWFWVGAAMCLAAILTYVFSEDLSLRPRRHASAEPTHGASLVLPSSP
jgi:hypothetical protein